MEWASRRSTPCPTSLKSRPTATGKRVPTSSAGERKSPKGRKDGATEESNGTRTAFHADPDIFPAATQFRPEYIEKKMCRYYSYLNKGLALHFNGRRYFSKNGLLDLLAEAMSEEPLYPIIHLEGHDIEVAFTHGGQYGEEHYSFVNGQHTTQGGTHQAAFREAIVKTLRDFFKKNYEAGDIRSSLVAAISIKVKEPVFESQTKTKLGSNTISPEGETIRTFVGNFIARELDNYLHKNPETAKALEAKIKDSERDRKELSGIQKLARENARKAKIHNKNLRDCRVHYNSKHSRAGGNNPLHYGRHLRLRLHHYGARRGNPGRFLPAGQAAELLRHEP